MKIEVLPSNIANLIAAGEVVQNPSSVVKEMMENSLDAGATSVTVMASDAGRTLIRIIDNGCGMAADDAVTCFGRHATSKIATAEDLDNIRTFGFRGEALASVAAVAEVTLRTRRPEDEVGTEVVYADSSLVSTRPVSAPAGTDFSVRNLFYNVPARRKFLKSDAAEFRRISAEFTRVAMVRPEVSFKLVHNGKTVFDLRPVTDLRHRIMELVGKEIVKEIVEAGADTSVVRITGYVGKPECARKTAGNQYLFVNGRFFRSAYIHKAVMKAYEGLVAQGATPSYFLMLETDPHTVDVNIHPSKTEVKFEDESVIFQIVFACVKEALGKNSFVPSIDFDLAGAPEIPVFDPKEDVKVSAPLPDMDPEYNPFDNDGFDNENYFAQDIPSGGYARPAQSGFGGDGFTPARMPDFRREQDYGKLFEGDAVPGSSDVLMLSDKYVLLPYKSSVMLLNVFRARERIFYSRMIQSVAMGEIVSEKVLFPVTLEVGMHAVSLLEEYSEVLSQIGFEIAPMGQTSVVVYGQPSGYASDRKSVEDALSELICTLDEGCGSLRSDIISNLAVRLAHIAALSGKSGISRTEASSLASQLLDCEDASFSPYSKKKTYVLLDEAGAERLLG